MEFLLHTRPAASAPRPLMLLEDVLTGRGSHSRRAVLATLVSQTVVQHQSACR